MELLDWFAVGNHVCLVFPLLGPPLLQYIEKIKYCSLTHIRDIAWQMLVALARAYTLNNLVPI